MSEYEKQRICYQCRDWEETPIDAVSTSAPRPSCTAPLHSRDFRAYLHPYPGSHRSVRVETCKVNLLPQIEGTHPADRDKAVKRFLGCRCR